MEAQPYMPDIPERYGFGATLDPNGHICMWPQVEYALARARAAGGVQWYPPEEKPGADERVLGEWESGIYRMYYVDGNQVWREIDMQGRLRPSSTTVPIRWMRIPAQAEPPADPPPSTPVTVPKELQDLVNAIRKNWPWKLVLDAGDLSPYDAPDVGAPL